MADDQKRPEASSPPLSEAMQEIARIFEDPAVPSDEKLAIVDLLRARRAEGVPRSSTVDRIYATLGKPPPAPLTPDELAEFDREIATVNAAVIRRYSNPRQQQEQQARPRKRNVA